MLAPTALRCVKLGFHPVLRDGGETGIRTLEELAPLTVFKTVPFNRSGISPRFAP